MKVIIAVPIFVLHDHKMIIHTEHMMCMDLLASIRSHRCFVETYSYMYIGTNIYIDNIMYKHIHKVVWTTYFVSLYPIPNPCFPFCFCVFSGSLRVGPDSHKGPVARSGSNRWICENISEGHRPQGPGSSVKWPKLYVACLCHLYISGFQLLHSIASTIFQVFWRDYRLWSQLPPNRSGNIAQSGKGSILQSQSYPVSISHDNTSSLMWWVRGWIIYIAILECGFFLTAQTGIKVTFSFKQLASLVVHC